MNDDLYEILDKVVDEQSFIRFLRALARDRADEVAKDAGRQTSLLDRGANGWANHTIEDFLECASEWAEESTGGLQYYQKPGNPWRRCADIISMGKIYE